MRHQRPVPDQRGGPGVGWPRRAPREVWWSCHPPRPPSIYRGVAYVSCLPYIGADALQAGPAGRPARHAAPHGWGRQGGMSTGPLAWPRTSMQRAATRTGHPPCLPRNGCAAAWLWSRARHMHAGLLLTPAVTHHPGEPEGGGHQGRPWAWGVWVAAQEAFICLTLLFPYPGAQGG